MCSKLGQKWSCWDFEMLPPDYVTINQKSQSYSTNLHTKYYLSYQKEIIENFPVFHKNLHCLQNWDKKWSCLDFEVLPPDYVTIYQNVSPIPQIYIPNTTILTKNNFWKITQFSRKTYIVCKIGTKWSWWDFEVLPPDYVTINPNFSPIPQVYIPNNTILAKTKFWKISQFSEKPTLCAKLLQE